MGTKTFYDKTRKEWENYFDTLWEFLSHTHSDTDTITRGFRAHNKLMFSELYHHRLGSPLHFSYLLTVRKQHLRPVNTSKISFDKVVSQMNELFERANALADKESELCRTINLSLQLRPSMVVSSYERCSIAWFGDFTCSMLSSGPKKQPDASWFTASHSIVPLLRYQNTYQYEFDKSMPLLSLTEYAMNKFNSSSRDLPGGSFESLLREYAALLKEIQLKTSVVSDHIANKRFTTAYQLLTKQ